MAYWNGQQFIYMPPKPVEGYAGWEQIDCGCCAGIEWGGECPRECRDCGGSGLLFRHIASKAIADYPGGSFRGKRPDG